MIAVSGQTIHVGYHILTKHSADRATHSHHDFVELFWVTSGRGQHDVNGHTHPLSTGDLVFVRSRDEHRIASDKEIKIINIAFAATLIDEFAGRYFQKRTRFWDGESTEPILRHVDGKELSWLLSAAETLAADPFSRLTLDWFLLHLLVPTEQSAAYRYEEGPAWLQDACRQILSPHCFCGGVREFARIAGKSPEHLARTLKRMGRKSPSEIVNAARLRYAGIMLRTTDTDILTISLDCGFNSLSHFYQLFRASFGMTPRKYRILSRQALPEAQEVV